MVDVEAVMENLIEISKKKSDILNEVYSLTPINLPPFIGECPIRIRPSQGNGSL